MDLDLLFLIGRYNGDNGEKINVELLLLSNSRSTNQHIFNEEAGDQNPDYFALDYWGA